MVDFAGGTGTALDPYLVATAEQLNEVRNNSSAHFKQTADISLAGYQAGEGWVPIGTQENKFMGIYDGDGKKITGLKINRSSTDYQGLFGFTDFATIQNLVLKGITIVGQNNIGTLVGYLYRSSVTNCHCEFISVEGQSNCGGFSGTCGGSSNVKNCTCIIDSVMGTVRIGGFTSSSDLGSIEKSSIKASLVKANGNLAGGFCGNSYGNNIQECFCEIASIEGNEVVGGFVGSFNSSSVENCYCRVVEENVTGVQRIGGFAGSFRNGPNIRYCFCLNKPSGDTFVDGFMNKDNSYPSTPTVYGNFFDKTVAEIASSDYAIGKTTAEMKTKATFTDAGWDFYEIWDIESGGYPTLLMLPPSPPSPPSPPGNVTNLSVTKGEKKLIIKWSDPADDAPKAIWAGTKLVRKIGSYPANEEDGVLVTNSTTKNQYSVNGYEDADLGDGKKYFYQLFPYSTEGLINTNIENRISGITKKKENSFFFGIGI